MDLRIKTDLDWFYPWLRRMTSRLLASERTVTLQPTALANDVVVRLLLWNEKSKDESAGKLKVLAIKIAKQLLVDRGRKQGAKKRYIDRKTYEQAKEQFSEYSQSRGTRVLEVMDAVDQLNSIDPVLGQLVVLRFFDGLDIDASAAKLGLSRRTAIRRWIFAKAFLKERILFQEGSSSVTSKEVDVLQ
jgi:RNA polymerase sigma factor (TIGR02999 family)